MVRGDLLLGRSKQIVIFKTPSLILGALQLIISFISQVVKKIIYIAAITIQAQQLRQPKSVPRKKSDFYKKRRTITLCICFCLYPDQYYRFRIDIIIFMDQFLECQRQFERLVANGLLPMKMKAKLKYIQSSVLEKHNSEESHSLLPDFEKLSLQEMNKQTQKAFFINIIRCFVSSQSTEHFKNLKVKIRKRGSSSSHNYYLTCVGSKLKVLKNKNKEDIWRQFSMGSTKITSIYQEVKKKYTFSIEQDRVEYQLFFDKETTCARIHSLIQNLICERNPSHKYQNEEYPRQILEEQEVEDNFNEETNIMNEEIDYMKSLKKAIDKLISNEGKFKLYKNLQNGKIQVNTQNNSVRLLLFVQKCHIARYIECFVKFDCWNTQVDTFKVIKRIRANSYLAYIKLKRYNIWTSERQAYITITYFKDCKCLLDGEMQLDRKSYKTANRHYILIKTVDYKEQGQKKVTPMNFNQVIQFSEVEDFKDKIFLNLLSDVDFGTFQLLAQKSEININLLKDVSFLTILYKEQSIQNTSQNWFQHDRCACTIRAQLSRINSKIEEPESAIRRQSTLNINSEISPIKKQKNIQLQEIMKAIHDESNWIKNEKIIQIIKKRLYESYYLKERFQFGQNEAIYKQSNYTLDADTDFLFQEKSWIISKDDEYTFVDQEELKLQKGILKLILKQITSNILAGKSIMTMSLPVQVFYTKGMLQGVVDILGFTPKFLNDAAKSIDPIEQIKNIAAGFIFIFACHPKVCKPFNPILGQTYQGIIGGIPVFAEQISHHPPISTFYMKTNKFEAYGNFDMHVDLGLNAAYSKNYGLFHVRIFESNTHFVIKYPDLEVGGIMFGDRTLKLKGKGFILEKNNNIYLEYSIGKQAKKLYEYSQKLKATDLVGGIFKVRSEFATKLLKQDKKKSTEGAKFEDIVQKYSQITGKWYGNIYFDGVEYKSLEKGPFPILPRRQKILLPSDSLFREDITYKRWDDNKRSNEEKQVLQNLQRRDKKLREKHKK